MKRAWKDEGESAAGPTTTTSKGRASKRPATVSLVLPTNLPTPVAAPPSLKPLTVEELCLATEAAPLPLTRLCRDAKEATNPVARRRIAELLGGGGATHDAGAGEAALSVETPAGAAEADVSTLFTLAGEDDDGNVRASAVRSLAQLVATGRFALGGEMVARLHMVAGGAAVDPHFFVRETALTLLVQLSTLSSPTSTRSTAVGGVGLAVDDSLTIQRRTRRMLQDVDPRVRSAALAALLELQELQKGPGKLDIGMYVDSQRALTDDDETVRSAALDLILTFGSRHPEALVPDDAVSASTTARLADNAFVTLCSAATDLSPKIRAKALVLLGELTGASEDTLLQTFDKKVMSHLRRKMTEHEAMRKAGSSRAGPLRAFGDLDVENMSLMSTGACGAFVHGLEDEFFEVREAAIRSICKLAAHSTALAEKSLDFLADMFNDEIDSVRLLAIDGLRAFACSFIFRLEQVELMLGILKDASSVIRHAMHLLIAEIRVGSVDCLRLIVLALHRNIKMYRQDRVSIWDCLYPSGRANAAFAEFMVEELLKTGVHFSTAEPNVDDPAYIAIVIFITNAAAANPNVLTLVPPFFPRHHRYLKGRLPKLIPFLDFLATSAFVGDLFLPAAAESGAKPPRRTAAVRGDDPLDGLLRTVDRAVLSFSHDQNQQALAELESCRRRLGKLGRYTHGSARGEVRIQHDFVQWLLHYCRLTTALSRSSAVDAAQPTATATLYHLSARHQNLPARCLGTLAVCRALSHAQELCRLLLRSDRGWDVVNGALQIFVDRVVRLLERTALPATDAASLEQLRVCTEAIKATLASATSVGSSEAIQGVTEALMRLIRSAPPQLGAASGASQSATATVLEPSHGFNALSLTRGLPQELRVVARIANVEDVGTVRIVTTFPDNRRVTLAPPRHHFRSVGRNQWVVESTVFVSNDLLADAFEVQISVGVTFVMDIPNDPILQDGASTSAETRLDGATGLMQIGKAVPASLRVTKPKKPS